MLNNYGWNKKIEKKSIILIKNIQKIIVKIWNFNLNLFWLALVVYLIKRVGIWLIFVKNSYNKNMDNEQNLSMFF
jgi:hypothetical protein